ncbi:hypothetical protein [Fervidibacillus albus]|uniref:Aminoglycoside phosphotransferase domain-containing protein n=1 Tax=Fervidibacillus albus TaxID=2980026 RepID=A0A9E8RU46_9BACI|nr:hypothetical protein [Fervidibacillus albus]WAA08820.1 hypothetical protein OE104_09375 [Fervidibacillus albus]
MNLSNVFKKKILKQMLLQEDDGYLGGASHVWLVQTEEGEVIVRTSALTDIEEDPFWYGMNIMFGIDPRRVFVLENLNRSLALLTTRLSVPQVLNKALFQEREFVEVEKLPGKQLNTFIGMSSYLIEDFGKAIAQIHLQQFDFFGSFSSKTHQPLTVFNERLIEAMKKIVNKYYMNNYDKNQGIQELLPRICQEAQRVPVPSSASYVMMDMDASQFLTNGERVTAVVDTEGYVIGPRELELVAFEYILDNDAAQMFKKGYTSILEFPDLSKVRYVYRYFLRLLEVQGSKPIDKWMNHPILFH